MGSAPRRRRAGADRVDRLHEGIEGDGGAGDVHRIRERLSRRRTQQDVQLGYESINSERPACICFGAYFRAAELGTVHAAILAGGAGVGIAI